MEKEFNVTGTCIPEMHYMIDTTSKLDDVMELIRKGKYFTINRPRQYRKTTTMFLLSKKLNKSEEYFCIKTSFEGVGDLIFEDEKIFSKEFLDILAETVAFYNDELSLYLEELKGGVSSFKELSRAIAKFIKK